MLDWFKRHFIPHSGNDHRPHFLHGGNMRQIIGVVLLFELILFVLPTLSFVDLVRHSNLSSVLPAVLAAETNNQRNQNALPGLITDDLLTAAAQLKAEDMAAKGYFSHNSPDGKTPWYWLDQVGYSYEYAGENLAVNFSDSIDVTNAWMNSPTHRSNITKVNYTEMGTGVAFGVYEGRDTVFVVQLYANPKVVPQKSSARLAIEETLGSKVAEAEVKQEPLVAVTESQPNVLGDETSEAAAVGLADPAREPSLLESTLASPRNTANVVFYVVIGIVVMALFLSVVIKFEHQHPDLVTNGLFAIIFIFGVYLANAYVAKAWSTTTSYTDTVQQQVEK